VKERTSIPEDSKRNLRIIKAGLVLASFAFGTLPWLIGGAIVLKMGTPILNEMVIVATQGAGHPSISTDMPRKQLTGAFLPAAYHQLVHSVACDWRSKRRLCEDLGIDYHYGVLDHKITWEHIKKTGSREYEVPVVLDCDLRRKMGWEEHNLFQEFCHNHGNMPVERILLV
jgi:hypothetical protein